jgi:uncharacterized protein YutE (UPF0331/DUF86 family)
MIVKTRTILERLHTLDEYIRLPEPYREWESSRLTEDRITYGGVLHYLQLATQIVMDVSAHLQVELDIGRVTDYKEVIQNLGKHSILPSEFADRISGMTGFGNILIHEYLTVDPLKVQQALQEGLKDLRMFIVYITDFLRREGYLEQ